MYTLTLILCLNLAQCPEKVDKPKDKPVNREILHTQEKPKDKKQSVKILGIIAAISISTIIFYNVRSP